MSAGPKVLQRQFGEPLDFARSKATSATGFGGITNTTVLVADDPGVWGISDGSL